VVVSAFLDEGRRVVVPWIVAAEREQLARLQADALRAGRLVLLEADVAEPGGAVRAAAAAPALEVLVNAAGGFAGGAPVHETDVEVWDRLYRINLRTAVCACRAALPGLLARRRGLIVNVASRAAFERPAGLAAYSASKDAVVVLTETLQKEVAGFGVRVNALAPATIDTPANRAAMPGADVSSWTPPARIAEVIRWLASEAGAALRGAVLPV
jgi:NAD(P)-dependent dehydrogenase (short-subunit alcohol dehydrogenase family)